MSVITGFQPRYIEVENLKAYGLPTEREQANIVNLVESASTLIDEYCGRQDTDGNGSLVYSTYEEQLYLPSGRNLLRLTRGGKCLKTFSFRVRQPLLDFLSTSLCSPHSTVSLKKIKDRLGLVHLLSAPL